MSAKVSFDVDIDFANRDLALDTLRHTGASIARNDKLERHKTGVYFQDIPNDPAVNQSNVDYKTAQDLGFFKFDFLNVSVYDDVRDEAHLEILLADPNWELFEYEEIVAELFHIRDYFNLVKRMKPTSVEELAMVLAIIRPSKKYLMYKSWDDVAKEVWVTPPDGTYHFKRAHAISYAMAVIVQLNLLVEKASQLS